MERFIENWNISVSYIETTWTFLYIFGFLLWLNPFPWISKIDRKKAQQFKLKKICVTRAITKREKKKKQNKINKTLNGNLGLM